MHHIPFLFSENQRAQLLEKLEKLESFFKSGKIPVLEIHEIHPNLPKGGRENFLYFTMTCALNFQRNSPKLWQSAFETWNDTDTRFVFFPEERGRWNEENLRQALMKHKLALQPHKHTCIWKKLLESWHTYFKDDPRKLFEQCEYDAGRVLVLFEKSMKSFFPYLSGPKLRNYLLFILLEFTDLNLKNQNEISIIPDTHIMKATMKLGMMDHPSSNPDEIAEVWKTLLKGTKYSPIMFHSILWNWSRNNFEPEV